MSALRLALATLLMACGQAGTPAVDEPPRTVAETLLATCASYADAPDAYGFCITERVGTLPSPESVEAVCPKAGTFENECRAAWVLAQSRSNVQRPPEELLAACGSNQDCKFQVLDTRYPRGDVAEAVKRCEKHVADYARYCVGHALHRWVAEQKPDDAEVARVAAAVPKYAVAVGHYMGIADACHGTAHCGEGDSPAEVSCRASRDDFRAFSIRCPKPPPKNVPLASPPREGPNPHPGGGAPQMPGAAAPRPPPSTE